jgi:hypothetical protein
MSTSIEIKSTECGYRMVYAEDSVTLQCFGCKQEYGNDNNVLLLSENYYVMESNSSKHK